MDLIRLRIKVGSDLTPRTPLLRRTKVRQSTPNGSMKSFTLRFDDVGTALRAFAHPTLRLLIHVSLLGYRADCQKGGYPMPNRKLHLTSNQIALLALGLSILSSGFGVYQWWSSGREDRIRAAIDLSDKYIEQAVTADVLLQQYRSGTANYESLEPVRRQAARIEYIAFLVNHGYVNPDYLAQRTVCDIIAAADPSANSEVNAFKNNYAKNCLKSASSN
jgi:hypothetical protein